MEKIQLRRIYDENEADTIIDIQNRAFKEDYQRFGECPAYDEEIPQVQKMIRERIIYKVCTGSKAIGIISLRRDDERSLYIRVFCIIPECQGKGIGTQAMRMIFSEYYGMTKWTLLTPKESERNCHFYEKFGFRVMDTTKEAGGLELNVYQKNS